MDEMTPQGTYDCVKCGRDAKGDVCCDTATYDDGSHLEPFCSDCCGPHYPRRGASGFGEYERTDCDT